jgi:hypothetical protein
MSIAKTPKRQVTVLFGGAFRAIGYYGAAACTCL